MRGLRKIDLATSRELAKLVEAEDRCCWKNAVLALAILGNTTSLTLAYVEGVAVILMNGLHVCAPHGWIEKQATNGSRTVIDPTPVYHSGSVSTVYFGASRYLLATIEAKMRRAKNRDLPLPLFLHESIAQGPYKAAERAAAEYASTEAPRIG